MYGKNNDLALRKFPINLDFPFAVRIGENSLAGECEVNASEAMPGPGARRDDAADVMGRSSMSSVSISCVGISV